MGYEDIELPKKDPATENPEVAPTAEDSEAFLAYNQKDNRNDEKKEEEKKSPKDEDKAIEEEKTQINTPEERPVFAPIDKSDIPMTSKVESILSKELKNIKLEENHFLLPVPNPGDRFGIKISVYLFGSKECVKIHISSKSKVIDVIRHLISVTKAEQKDPAAYELRLIDDDEDYYTPFYEISALVPQESVGEFNSLALVLNKNYSPPKHATAADLASLRTTKSKSHSYFVIFIKLSFLETRIEMEMNMKICTLRDLLRKINKRFDVGLSEQLY